MQKAPVPFELKIQINALVVMLVCINYIFAWHVWLNYKKILQMCHWMARVLLRKFNRC